MKIGLVGTVIASSILGASAVTMAQANDSVAEVGIGGLVLARTEAVQMVREDLFLSPDEVTVDYVFRNTSDADVKSVVAFPLPDIQFDIERNTSLPDGASDDFLGFEITVDGKPLKPEIDQRAFSLNIDVTDLLKQHGIPIYGYDPAVEQALEKLPEAVAEDFLARGIIAINTYIDPAKGEIDERLAAWTMRSAYWWEASFPKGQDIKVHHRYKPAVGGSAGTYIIDNGKLTETGIDYQTRYCVDEDLIKTLKGKVTPDGYLPFNETWIDYILTSGGNWATGQIGEFHLTIDKGSEKNLVSFCGEGVKKTGPTRFEMTAKDFYPDKDISILILQPNEQGQ